MNFNEAAKLAMSGKVEMTIDSKTFRATADETDEVTVFWIDSATDDAMYPALFLASEMATDDAMYLALFLATFWATALATALATKEALEEARNEL